MNVNSALSPSVQNMPKPHVENEDVVKKVKHEVAPVKAEEAPRADDTMKTRGKLLDIRV